MLKSLVLLVTALFVGVFCSLSASSLAEDSISNLTIEKKPTFILLQSERKLKVDPESFSRDFGKIVLIKNKNLKQNYSAAQLGRFDEFYEINELNFETLSPLIQHLIDIHGKENLSILVNEEGLLIDAARLRDYFGINGSHFHDVERFRNKLIMKSFVSKAGILVPKHRYFDLQAYNDNPEEYLEGVIQYLNFPIFAKPIDGVGCLNACKILNRVELEKWATEHREFNNFELDEFIEGTLYHCDSLIQNGEIVFSSGGEYILPGFDFLLGKSSGSVVLTPSHPHFEKIFQFNKTVMAALNPPNGGTHLEFFITKLGEIIFVEIAARTPGGLVPECYSKSHAINLEEIAFKLQMGDRHDFSISPTGIQVAWITFPMTKGTVQRLIEPSFLSSQYEITWNVKEGEIILDSQRVRHYIANVLLWNDNYKDLKDDINYLRINPPYLIAEN